MEGAFQQMALNKPLVLDEQQVAGMFNRMADEYDEITDLWYGWLFCRLHYFLSGTLGEMAVGRTAKFLDVGCGTGFQSIVFNLCGHDGVGIDVATALLERARRSKGD